MAIKARLIAALLRHGEYQQLPDTPSALQPFPLTKPGAEQAERSVTLVEGILEMFKWSLHPVIDSSRLLRGWQTAEVLCRGLQIGRQDRLQIESFDALAERSLGSAANLSLPQIESVLRDDPRFPSPPKGWKSDSHYRLPLQGAESLMDAGARVAGHLELRLSALQAQVEVDTVKLFVGHGAAFRHAAHHLGVLPFERIAAVSMYHCRPVFLERLPDGSWQHLTGDWKIRSSGDSFDD
ncbi:MAG: histidine phosphatase family protein [Candidatus Thiodiazotropha sp.]